ncbi:MAG TPA: ATP-dependent DNA ligase [Candidatus Dormibacteraeota bacterium]|nr:ATP-dependent DNA ligase [Candidatus Dormibacteraeota bacterium]
MRRWSEVAERVAATTRTSQKTSLLAEYLRSLPPADLPIACTFFAGRPFPENDPRSAGIGWASIAAAAAELTGGDASELGAAYDRWSDLGRAVEDLLAAHGHSPPPELDPTLHEVAAAFARIEAASGPAAKALLFRDLLVRCDPRSARYVVRILTGELRIGLREGLLEAAIAAAFERPLAEVKRASQLTGELGATAALAREDRLGSASLTLFRPLKCMLAAPIEDAAEAIRRLGPTVWVEDKYDGIRAQLHRAGEEVRLYSRDLHDVTEQFPEIAEGAAALPWDGALDGEVLAFRDGVVLPFLQLQARLGRKRPSAAIRAEVPVVYVAFDLLAAGARDGSVVPWLDRPLRERRLALEALTLPLAADGGVFALSHLATAESAEGLEAAFAAARERRNEGLMVKDPESRYLPGRRGFGWLKMKKALATLDCVVVGVEVGHGKRHGVLSDYTFAVRDEAGGTLVTIGKAYSGLTDAELAELGRWYEAHTVRQHGRYRVVEPAIVVEVAFDVLMRSTRHRSGFALRFPRIVRIRDDKTVDDIDTLATVEAVYRGLQAGAEHLVTASARR